MGNHKQIQTLMYMYTILVFLFLFITLSAASSSSSSSSSTLELQPQENPSNNIPAHYQVFYLKNTNPIFLNKQERFKKRKKTRKQSNNKKKMVNNLGSRPFSVMLPKGFVPSSGSSPCHNEQPTSVSFRCHLSAGATDP